MIKWISFPVLLREAISRVCEAVPGAKGAFKKRKVLRVCLLLYVLAHHSGSSATQLLLASFPGLALVVFARKDSWDWSLTWLGTVS